jgi:drug/metabolite transporter (DMT)-like permease
MESWIWIPISVGAAFMQAVRTAGQKELTKHVSTLTASYVRFLFGLPFALAYLLALKGGFQAEWPAPAPAFFLFAALCAAAQIAGTLLLIHLFSYRNFAVGTTYARTEALLTALVGTLFFHEVIGLAGWTAIAISVLGVVLVTLARSGLGGQRLLVRLADPVAWMGIASGLGFALASLFLRRASLSLQLDNWLFAAALTLTMVLSYQTAALTVYLVLRDRPQFIAILRNWRAALFVGITSMLGSTGWFTAMTIERAAYVKALGQIEFIFTLGISILFFREKSTAREIVGMALVAAGIVVLLLFG